MNEKDTVRELAAASDAFLTPLRMLEGFQQDAFHRLCKALEGCAEAWRFEERIPRVGASILVDLYMATDAASASYPGAEAERIRDAAITLSELVRECVALREADDALGE